MSQNVSLAKIPHQQTNCRESYAIANLTHSIQINLKENLNRIFEFRTKAQRDVRYSNHLKFVNLI